MVDFRKILLALIAGALLLATVASAQDSYSCVATAETPIVRAEGLTELVGDVLIFCSGSPGTVNPIVTNIRMTLNTNATPNVIGTVSGLTVLDSVAVLDDGFTAAGFALTGYEGTAPIAPYTNGAQNVYQAVKVSNTEIEWQQVTLYGGGLTNPTRMIRLTNVRANAQALGSGNTVNATINISNPSVPLTNNFLHVADIRRGVYMEVVDTLDLRRCEVDREDAFTVRFTEGGPNGAYLANAFREEGSGPENLGLTGTYFNESGFVIASVTGNLVARSSIGEANNGAQLRLVVTGIPAGVSLVPETSATGTYGVEADLVSNTRSGSTQTIIWEIVSSDSESISLNESIDFDIEVDYDTEDSDANLLGTAMAAGGFAPVSTVTTASSTALEPRFIDSLSPSPAAEVFVIGPCRTILLFPYLTNAPGFDTGLAISNTSSDPLGTMPQAGTCTLNFYGQSSGAALTAAQAVQTTPVVPSGGQFLMLLSSNVGVALSPLNQTPVVANASCASANCVLPGFQGYMFATCNFQFAHGFAFISDLGASKLAMGYLALVVPDRESRSRLPKHAGIALPFLGNNQGEQLGN